MSDAPQKKPESPPTAAAVPAANALLPPDLVGKPQEFVRELAAQDSLSRRGFLGACVIGGATLAASQAGYAAVRFFFSAGVRIEEQPVPLAKSSIPETGKVVAYGTRKLIVVKVAEEYLAFDASCTHLGCLVQWRPAERKFYCPCHTGFFDAAGRNISGPPPRPLERIKVKVEGETVIVGAEKA